MSEVIGLFATPLMRVEKLLDEALVADLAAQFRHSAKTANNQSRKLAHTQMFAPDAREGLAAAGRLIVPRLEEFGELLFGARLAWTIKEMWVNVLDKGGHQSMHNHANSFVSGIVYLTPTHPSATTVFIRNPGASGYVFSHAGENTATGEFNAGKYVAPEPSPGDMLLFPSYLLHEVPPNQGTQRISLAFNAIPDHLDSWGYSIRFAG